MNDKDGEEQLIINAKDGKMLFLIDKNGIQITNELGDINIKAKKVSFESENMLMKAPRIPASMPPTGLLNSKAVKPLLKKRLPILAWMAQKSSSRVMPESLPAVNKSPKKMIWL